MKYVGNTDEYFHSKIENQHFPIQKKKSLSS